MKIRPFYNMYNIDMHKYFNAREVYDVSDELGAEYIGTGLAEAVEEKARAEPTPEPFGNSEKLPEAEPVEEQPEAETEKKPRTRKANNKQ